MYLHAEIGHGGQIVHLQALTVYKVEKSVAKILEHVAQYQSAPKPKRRQNRTSQQTDFASKFIFENGSLRLVVNHFQI